MKNVLKIFWAMLALASANPINAVKKASWDAVEWQERTRKSLRSSLQEVGITNIEHPEGVTFYKDGDTITAEIKSLSKTNPPLKQSLALIGVSLAGAWACLEWCRTTIPDLCPPGRPRIIAQSGMAILAAAYTTLIGFGLKHILVPEIEWTPLNKEQTKKLIEQGDVIERIHEISRSKWNCSARLTKINNSDIDGILCANISGIFGRKYKVIAKMSTGEECNMGPEVEMRMLRDFVDNILPVLTLKEVDLTY